VSAPDGLAGLAAREAGALEEAPPAERVAELEGERAVIVAWLRAKRLQTQDYTGDDNAVSWTLHVTADRIERGEHRREEKSK
jgi:hypothetical protein